MKGMRDSLYEPAIKWSGSKRKQAENIIKHFPKEIDTYFEPFCGGASVLRMLLDKKDIKIKRYVCSDINAGLIDLWNEIIAHPEMVYEHYKTLWTELNKDGDIRRKTEYFWSIRSRYNKEHNPLDFMFIMRTTTNGMPRYNLNGDFNNSFHTTRNGILPGTLRKIIYEWSQVLKENNVEFISCPYDYINPKENDFLYLDPPYFNAKGMYYGRLDYEKFWMWLRKLPCRYVLSFDGISGEKDNTCDVPEDLYSKHEYLLNGNSSFKRIMGGSNRSVVYESLYIK